MEAKVGDWFAAKGNRQHRIQISYISPCGCCHYAIHYHPQWGKMSEDYYPDGRIERDYDRLNRLEVLVLFGEA